MIRSSVRREIDGRIEKIDNLTKNLEQMLTKAERYREEARKIADSLERNIQALSNLGIQTPKRTTSEEDETFQRRLHKAEQQNSEVRNYQESSLRAKSLDKVADKVAQVRKLSAFD